MFIFNASPNLVWLANTSACDFMGAVPCVKLSNTD
jgi:hypothetical protein